MDVMMAQKPYFTTLKNRSLITVSGPERRSFLQGLITNDINKLNHEPCVYACMLSPQGKFLYDFFITEHKESLWIECEGGERAQSLAKLLMMYKLRADVEIDIKDTVVYAIMGTEHGYKDPRHAGMGYRSFDKPEGITEAPFETWDSHRISLTIPDGSRDLLPQKSTMDEGRMDQLNAVDYDKGCYVGQELTARVHYRGLGKRHLETVKTSTLPEGTEIRSSCGDYAIALIKKPSIK